MFLFIFWLAQLCAAFFDVTYVNPVYTAYYSTAYKAPVMVVYTLYRGGGDCSRTGVSFSGTPETARASDYALSGYDQGHLCNAEDFAFNCEKQRLTFTYYNCVPQTPNLNRGVWKTDENQVRRFSQTDSVRVICGAIFTKPYRAIGSCVYVPTYCYKVVQSLTTKQVLMSKIYTNTSPATATALSVPELEKILGAPLPLVR